MSVRSMSSLHRATAARCPRSRGVLPLFVAAVGTVAVVAAVTGCATSTDPAVVSAVRAAVAGQLRVPVTISRCHKVVLAPQAQFVCYGVDSAHRNSEGFATAVRVTRVAPLRLQTWTTASLQLECRKIGWPGQAFAKFDPAMCVDVP